LEARLDRIRSRGAAVSAALSGADAIVSLTDFMAGVHAANGVPRGHITVKPDCVDLAEFEPVTPQDARGNVVRFGYLGQITPVKGLDVLIRAFRLLERDPAVAGRAELAIHGRLNSEPSYAAALQRLADGSSNITFAGPYSHRDALRIMNGCSVIITPSIWYENSPRVILEAFAARRTVIGSRLGGISEIVQDEVNGLLFERGDAQDLARVMRRVVLEPDLRARLQAQIPAPRTLEEDMRDMLEIYERVSAPVLA
jgi:glycosyltransferase involved in cell wall biosynthesis